jgi:hypothetical protein
MKSKTFMVIIAALMVILTACKNDEMSNAELIVGKWREVTTVSSGLTNGGAFTYSYTGTGSDYASYGSDGTVAISEDGVTKTETYTLSGTQLTNTLSGNTTAWTIKTLSGNSLIIYSHVFTDANNYTETTSTFEK